MKLRMPLPSDSIQVPTVQCMTKKNEGRCQALYDLVEPYDAFVGKFVSRPHGLATDRPQEYLACVQLVRSFRLLIGGLWLSASGYSYLSPNLGRTIWEIAIRLLYSQKDPTAATLGFFIHADIRQIEAMEAELAYRNSNTIPVGHLPENCRTAQEHRAWLEGVAQARGVDIASAVKIFGQGSSYRPVAAGGRIASVASCVEELRRVADARVAEGIASRGELRGSC